MHRRIVLLGASNLTRSFPLVVSLARCSFEEQLSFFIAKGFGRSYGEEAGCFGKKFPGIFFSGLWNGLDSAKAAPISAVITDIGNDLGYEVPVETLLDWVAGCIDNIQRHDAEIVLTDVPIDSIQEINERKFLLFRALMFPNCRLQKHELVERVKHLKEGLHELARPRNIPVFPVQKQWYGFDPIHPRWSCLSQMWNELLSNFSGYKPSPSRSSDSWLNAAYLRLLRAERWSQFGVSRRAVQPQGCLTDQTLISLY